MSLQSAICHELCTHTLARLRRYGGNGDVVHNYYGDMATFEVINTTVHISAERHCIAVYTYRPFRMYDEFQYSDPSCFTAVVNRIIEWLRHLPRY
jgi:hypothetical protein